MKADESVQKTVFFDILWIFGLLKSRMSIIFATEIYLQTTSKAGGF